MTSRMPLTPRQLTPGIVASASGVRRLATSPISSMRLAMASTAMSSSAQLEMGSGGQGADRSSQPRTHRRGRGSVLPGEPRTAALPETEDHRVCRCVAAQCSGQDRQNRSALTDRRMGKLMTKESFERIFRKGVPPTEHQYPGLGYKISKEHGMIIERDVAVPMRDGVKIYIDVTRPEGNEKVPAL